MALGYGRTGTNQFACAKFIVDTNGLDKGATHTTIAGALTDAQSGDTIFIKPGTYTENLTLSAGVNLTAFVGDELTPNVTISGKATATFAGTCTISNIRLQTNSDNLLVVSGASATIVNLDRCYLNCSNNTGISFTSSSGSSQINIIDSHGDLGTTGIGFFASSSSGTLLFDHCVLDNSGSSTTASTISAGSLEIKRGCHFPGAITTSGTAAIGVFYSRLELSSLNTTALIIGGSGTAGIDHCIINSGSAVAITVTSSLNLHDTSVGSTNGTAAIDGAGTLVYSLVNFSNSASAITTTTITSRYTDCKGISFDEGTNFLDYYEEGTWTPTADSSNSNMSSQSYSVQVGRYTRVGNIVNVYCNLSYTASAGTGNLRVLGLPFTVLNTSNHYPRGSVNLGNIDVSNSTVSLCVSGLVNTTQVSFGSTLDNAASIDVPTDAGGSISFSMVYEV